MAEKELLAPCGLYCGVCGILMAHRDNNQKFKERLSTVYGCKPEDIACEGCMSETRFSFCQHCPIRSCAVGKEYEGCHECADFPCAYIENFPIPIGKQGILRAIPEWRELGTEKWVEAEEKRYTCPECGQKLFRGAGRCRNCKTPVSPD
jgi:hypothetical protein